jgi:phytoene dehydrogenase-like protein
LGAADALRFARFAIQPVRRFGDERFAGEGAPLLLAGNALHTDLAPEGAGSAIYGWLLAMLGQTYGFPVPTGGARRLVDALTDRLAARGGQLRLGARVERVLVEGGAAVGVRLAGGETIRARRAVLADTAAPALYRDLVGVEHLPSRLVRDLDSFQWDARTLKVNWALSGPIPWTAPGARGAGTVHLGVDMDGLTYYAAALAARRMPRQPFLLVGQMTTADPTRSPDGTESAWCYTHLPEQTEITADDVATHVERIENTMQRHAPGFRELVLGRSVQSPAQLEDADANLVGGAINGGTANLHQQLVFRPVPGLGGAETVVDRLYLAGSSAHPGGGVHGGPGHNAALAALRRDALTGPLRRRVLRFAMERIYR